MGKYTHMKNTFLAALFVSSIAGSAFAAVTDYPVDVYSRPTVLPAGVFEGNLDVAINLSDDTAFKSTLVSPNIRYGVNDSLTVGLFHGRTGSLLNQGSLCLGDNCGKTYNNVAAEAQYQLSRGETSVAFIGSLEANALDPELALGLRVGADVRIKTGDKLMVQLVPQLGFGITNRDLDANFGIATLSAPYNRDYLNMPVLLNFKQTENLNLQLITGLAGSLSGIDFGDSYRVPAGVGAVYATSDHTVDLGARFVFPALIAAEGIQDGIKARELGLFVTFRN